MHPLSIHSLELHPISSVTGVLGGVIYPLFLELNLSSPETFFVLTHVAVSLASFLIGLVGGWYLAEDVDLVTRANLRKFVAIVITIVWASSVVAGIFLPTHSTPMIIHGIMGAVVGYLYSEEGVSINLSP